MARIDGVDIPSEKRVVISLTYIYGIGDTTAKKICKDAGVSEDIRVKNLTDDQLVALRGEVAKYKTEGDLRRGLPVRRQSTKTNARTRKGKRKTIANKKVATK